MVVHPNVILALKWSPAALQGDRPRALRPLPGSLAKLTAIRRASYSHLSRFASKLSHDASDGV